MRASLLGLALLLTACPGEPECSPSNCQGCCSGTVCYPGNEVTTCGISGALCDLCVGAQICEAGRCTFSASGGGSGGGGGTGTGGGTTANDPCNGVPTTGRCLNASTLEYCSAATGNGVLTVQRFTCTAGTACVLVNAGFQNVAECRPTGACIPNQTQCAGATTLQTCSAGGAWTNATCPGGCASAGTGAFCRPPSATGSLTAKLQYEAHGPNATLPTDWEAAKFTANAVGFLALSYTNCTTQCVLVDGQVTNAQGDFTLRVNGALDAGDLLGFATLAFTSDGGIAYLVADPQLDGGLHPVVGTTPNPRTWSWFISTAAVAPGTTVTITEGAGSGAARIFDFLRYAYSTAQLHYGGRNGLSLIAWLGFDNSWDCGECFATAPISAFGVPVSSQMFFNGSFVDQQYWSDPAIAHELGHWVMASYGFPAIEGGKHCIGVPDPPGQAWSEGFATWHSSNVRNNAVYFDKQGGAMFWVDLGQRAYSVGQPAWTQPAPANGLLQDLDENELAAMLWSLSQSSAGADQALFTALGSPRMTTRMLNAYLGTQSNLRGYTWHTWTNACPISSRQDLGKAIPALPDFLDALDCAGFSRAAIDTATRPSTAYPYPSASPLCQ